MSKGKNKNTAIFKNQNQNQIVNVDKEITINEQVSNEQISNEQVSNEQISNEILSDNIAHIDNSTLTEINNINKMFVDINEYEELKKKFLELDPINKELGQQLSNTLEELSEIKVKNTEIKKLLDIKNRESENDKAILELLKVELESTKSELKTLHTELELKTNDLELKTNSLEISNNKLELKTNELELKTNELETTKNKLEASNTMELLFKLKDTIKNKSIDIEDNILENNNNNNNNNTESKIIIETEEQVLNNNLDSLDNLDNKEQLLIKQRRKNRKF